MKTFTFWLISLWDTVYVYTAWTIKTVPPDYAVYAVSAHV